MKQQQDCKSNEQIKVTMKERRAVIDNNESIIGDTHDAQDYEDHDRAEATQCRTEFEDVPRHCSSRSLCSPAGYSFLDPSYLVTVNKRKSGVRGHEITWKIYSE